MKKYLLLPAMLISAGAVAQKIALTAHVSGGLFSFGGSSATASTQFIKGDVGPDFITGLDYYGKKPGLSYAAGLGLQWARPSGFLFGVQTSFESLQSSTRATSLVEPGALTSSFIKIIPTTGTIKLRNTFVMAYPNMGRRFPAGRYQLDVTAGPEIGFVLSSTEKINATTTEGPVTRYDVAVTRNHPDVDIRARVNAVLLLHKRIGFNLGYSYGFSNLAIKANHGREKAYTRYLRTGIVFHL
jgi:hypothetical protein